MIRLEEALDLVLTQKVALATEHVALSLSPGRILAEDISSDIDMPPFDKSAVDGFACRMEDITNEGGVVETQYFASLPLPIIETIPAGTVPKKPVIPGTCTKIMTGAMVPSGADCVVMVEDTIEKSGNQVAFTRLQTATNICYKGEDVRQGDIVLKKGIVVGPAQVAVLASVGAVNPLVYKLPSVGIISTGDELVEPSFAPGTAQIRNSNASQLEAQVRRIPASPVYYGIAADNDHSLRNCIEMALAENNLVLLTGGVSMGDFDFVPAVMQDLGVEILFKSIAIQPGKPTVFGRKGLKYIFGLPGNPVSSFVLFELLVKPFLMKMMGHVYCPVEFVLPMGCAYSRRKSERKSLIPVHLQNGEVFPIEYHGSAHINAYSNANAIMTMENGETIINQGDFVHVRPI